VIEPEAKSLHEIDTKTIVLGLRGMRWFWSCSCGSRGAAGLPNEAMARKAGERHVANSLKAELAIERGTEALRLREGDQPLPKQNALPAIHPLVAKDLMARQKLGIKRYGVALQPHNGRSALHDAYEEALDLACYLRQKIEEERLANVAANLDITVQQIIQLTEEEIAGLQLDLNERDHTTGHDPNDEPPY
jgi:hypothetical protein